MGLFWFLVGDVEGLGPVLIIEDWEIVCLKIKMSRNTIEKISLDYLAIVGVGVPAKSGSLVASLRLLWHTGEERWHVDSLTSGTDLFVEVEGLVLEQVDGHLGSRLGMIHVVSALVHVLVDSTVACIYCPVL